MKKEDIYNTPKHAGIYMFRNTVNGKCYIGQAIKLRKRLLHHINNFEHDRYDNPLYRAFRKYGLEAFELKILQTFHDALGYQTKQLLDMWEKRYIEEYNSYGSTGYNQTKGGDGGIEGYKFTEEQRIKNSKAAKAVQNDGRNLVYCYDTVLNKVITATSCIELSKILGIKIYTGSLRYFLIGKRYLLARNKEDFQRKIATFKTGNYRKDRTGNYIKGNYIKGHKYESKFTNSMKDDLLSGMHVKDFIIKYKVCKKTYYNYKNNLNIG